MDLMLRERENWLDDFIRPYRGEEEFYNYSVPIDLKENKDSYVVKADLPGLEERDVRVEFDKGVLIISGERKRSSTNEENNYYRREISYGKFSRSFRFGNEVKEDGIKARFNNGVLKIILHKKEKEKPKIIPLH